MTESADQGSSTPNAVPIPPLAGADSDNGSFARTIYRLLKSIALLAILFLLPVIWVYGWIGAAGFAAGAALSYFNFRSLSQGVEGLAARVADQQSNEKGGRIIMRFVLRYLLVGVIAYAIFIGSAQAFRGFLWGLCVPAGSLMLEAVWQGIKGFRPDR